ncbi:uncharacterized protein [Periplaneta americana]|uniref:uncharacterized protein isoform X3 n=1 Tax=Periplaneta americana TaxID=6978 RepID=UPI0037E70484
MDVIKTELDVDPLAVQSSDVTGTEEARSSPEKYTKVDSICGFKWEMKTEETTEQNTFPVMKCELEEKTFHMDRVKQENQLKLGPEESEVLTKRLLLLHHLLLRLLI